MIVECKCHHTPVQVDFAGNWLCAVTGGSPSFEIGKYQSAREIVIVESPFRGATPEDETGNKAYLNAILRQLVLVEGLAPFASHQLYTSALDDSKADERAAGIQAGFAFRRLASRTLVYTDLGISEGMRAGVKHAQELGQVVEFRTLPGWGE